jgi:hypothetical protein
VTTLSPVAAASQRLADAVSIVPDLRVVTSVAQSVSPPAVVIGPPRLSWFGYGIPGGQPTSGQWNVYLVVSLNAYAIDVLLELVASIASAIERYTKGVVVGSGPGVYPSPNGALPAYVITVQCEFNN